LFPRRAAALEGERNFHPVRPFDLDFHDKGFVHAVFNV
jgi:hypothetical protein